MDLESSFDLGLEGSKEASKGILRGGLEGTLLFNVVFLVFLAYVVESEHNIYHAHLLLFNCFFCHLKRKQKSNDLFLETNETMEKENQKMNNVVVEANFFLSFWV